MNMLMIKTLEGVVSYIVPQNIARVFSFKSNGNAEVTRIEFTNGKWENLNEEVDTLVARINAALKGQTK